MTDKQIIKLNELAEISQELELYEQCPYMSDDKRCKAHLNEVFWWKCYEFDNCLYKKYKAKEQECERLTSSLTEIKEMCQKHIKAEKIVMANDILQKISEVENET